MNAAERNYAIVTAAYWGFTLTDGALRGGAMQLIGFVLLWALLFAFVWFTYRPPHLPLFLDPVSGCYGLETPC